MSCMVKVFKALVLQSTNGDRLMGAFSHSAASRSLGGARLPRVAVPAITLLLTALLLSQSRSEEAQPAHVVRTSANVPTIYCPPDDGGHVIIGDEGLGAPGPGGPGLVTRGAVPRDEFFCDGGDEPPAVIVRPTEEIEGLNLEDTVAHYDTLAGETIVEPSNRVCIYAPRFAAVRQVIGLIQTEHQEQVRGIAAELAPQGELDLQFAATSVQRLQAEGQRGAKRVTTYLGQQSDGGLSGAMAPMRADEEVKAHANLQSLGFRLLSGKEKALVLEGIDAAIVWAHDKAVQVTISHQAANAVIGDRRAQALFIAETLPGRPALRVIKVASTDHAHPGEIIDFTIRFDNMGTETIGDLTLVDNLTARLEYVDGSAKSSRPAEFTTVPNVGGSLVLRWEFAEPLEPGEGGLVRFHCRVR